MAPGSHDVPRDAVPGDFCGHCGEPAGARDHAHCVRMLALEPPRFCTSCRRRMKVQVTPRDWSASCVEHGTVSG